MIRSVFSLVKTLQSNTSPAEIASGAALALFFGLTPLNHPHVAVLILLFFFFKINRGMTTLLFPLVKLVYVLGAVYLADRAGYFLLVKLEFLSSFWETAVHAPVLAYLDLNHTLVTGGLAIAAVAAPVVYLAVYQGVLAYRIAWKGKVDQLGLVRWIKHLSITQRLMSWWPKD